MKRRDISIGVAAVLVVASIVWLMDERKRRNQAQLSTHVTPTPTLSATPFAGPAPNAMLSGRYQGMNDPRWPIYWKKREQDRNFEWKTPIEFYGEVVDQSEQPIIDVEVRMNWTDSVA